jgi:amidase
MEIIELSARTLSELIHKKELSCAQVLCAYLDRIEALNPKFNAVVSLVQRDTLLKIAHERDAQLSRGLSMGWMHGMPIAIKDLAATAGITTTQGSPIFKNHVPTTDSLMVQRIRAAGAVLIGKTNVPEFGLGSHTFNEVFGTTSNAYDPSKSAGGSSGGAAVALALKMLPVADGSDFMGSLRNPAAWNNVFGMRPSFGRVPQVPNSDVFLSQLSTEGPMANDVLDLAALLRVQAGADPRAPLSLDQAFECTAQELKLTPTQIRIGWLGDLGQHLAMEPGVEQTCLSALQAFVSKGPKGCELEHIAPLFDPEQVWSAWLVWRRTLTASRIAPLLQHPRNKALIKAEALWEIEQAQGQDLSTLIQASEQRSIFYQQMLEHFKTHDVLALPSAQLWPFDKTLRYPSHIQTATGAASMDTYHRWMEVVIYATFAGLPCVSVPAGFNSAGLPMGVQLIGKPRGDLELLRIAQAYSECTQTLRSIKPKHVQVYP